MRTVITFIFLFVSFFSFSQGGYLKHFDFDSTANIFGELLVFEDTLIVQGIIRSPEPPYENQILFLKLDTLGNILHQNILKDSLNRHRGWGANGGKIIKLEDKSGYLCISRLIFEKPNQLLKLDNNGNILWAKTYSDSRTNADFYQELIPISDGYLIGASNNVLRSEWNRDLYLMKTDKEGNKIWDRYYGDTIANELLGAINVVSENEIIISGWRYYEYEWNGRVDDFNQEIIFAVDSLGNKKWEWLGEKGFDYAGVHDLTIDSLGNWVYFTHELKLDMTSDFYFSHPKFIKRDTNFNLLIEETYGIETIWRQRWSQLLPISQGGYIAIGANWISPQVGNVGDYFSYIARLNNNGDSLWTHNNLVFPDSQFVYLSRQKLESVVELSSGSIVASGTYENQPHFSDWQRGFLIKVDKNGCLDTLLCPPISTSLNIPFSKEEILVYPNPASDQISFSFGKNIKQKKSKTLRIFDLTGKTINAIKIPDNQSDFAWQRGKSPSGLYFYQISNQEKILHSGKVILQ